MRTIIFGFAVLLAVSMSTRLPAAVVVLGPSDAANGPLANGSAPINTTYSQADIGAGAWQANGTAPSQYYLYANVNSSTEHGLGQLTVSSLSSLSFSTFNTPAAAALPANWYLIIYTAPHAGGEASWYGNRLVLEPYLANSYANPGNQWVNWSTSAGANQLTINDTGGASGNLGFYGQPTLANIQSGPITWKGYPGNPSAGSATPINYANMDIEGIVLSTGNPWANGFTGLVDNVNIDTTQGNVQFDLEPAVPEPTTMIAGALLLLPFGVSMLRIFRKRQTA